MMKNIKNPWYKKFSMPHALTLLFIILVIVGLISWITSGIEYQILEEGETITKTTKTAGIVEWFIALFLGFKDGFSLVIYIFVLGIWIQMIIKSRALEAMVNKLGSKIKSDFTKIDKNLKYKNKFLYYFKLTKKGIKETWFFLPLLCFFTFAGSTSGSAEETVAYYPILIPLILASGFDVWTGFLIIFIGTGAGVMGSTVNPFSILAAVSASNTGLTNIVDISDGSIFRWIIWIIFSIVTFVYVMWYGARVKFDKNNSYTKDLFELHKQKFLILDKNSKPAILTKKRILIVIIFVMTFVILVLSVLPFWDSRIGDGIWDGRGSTSWFFNASVTNKILGFDVTKELSFIFGKWLFIEITFLFFISAILIGVIDWNGEKDFVKNAIFGMKEFLVVALAIGMARSISVLLDATELKDLCVLKISEIIKNSEGIKEITVPLLSYIFFIPLTFLIPSTSGLASAVFPILGPAINTTSSISLSGSITAFGMASGFANMFVPTYCVVIGALAVSYISYNKFLKIIWKYLLFMFVLGLIFVLLGGTITYLRGDNFVF